MPRLPTRYLLLSSFLFISLCFSSCHYGLYKSLDAAPVTVSPAILQPVIPANGSAKKYSASIDVLNKHFTGLIILKQTDSLSKHLVFVTELGMRMFDFEMRDTSITPVYLFEPLNKPRLIKVLKQDFKTMLLLDVFGKTADKAVYRIPGHKMEAYKLKAGRNSTFCTYQNNNQLWLQETYHRHKRKTRTSYTYNSPTQTYSHLKFKQYGLVKIYIELNEIPPSND